MVPHQKYIKASHSVRPYTVQDKYYSLFGLLDDVDLNDGQFWQHVGKCQQPRMKARLLLKLKQFGKILITNV